MCIFAAENMDKKDFKRSGSALRSYGRYSGVVFQMLAIIGLSFWGGKKLSDYLEMPNQLLTAGIGFAGLCLALYITQKNLAALQKEDDENKDTDG